MNNPAFRFLGRAACGGGRVYERCLWLRSSSTCWRTAGPCRRPPSATARWPSCPSARGRCRGRRQGRRRSSGYGRFGRDCRARSACSVRWRSGTCVSLISTSERSGGAHRSPGTGRGIDAHAADARESRFGQGTDLHRGQQRNVARHCTGGSASCTWAYLNCQTGPAGLADA